MIIIYGSKSKPMEMKALIHIHPVLTSMTIRPTQPLRCKDDNVRTLFPYPGKSLETV